MIFLKFGPMYIHSGYLNIKYLNIKYDCNTPFCHAMLIKVLVIYSGCIEEPLFQK